MTNEAFPVVTTFEDLVFAGRALKARLEGDVEGLKPF
jgi:hypothetical protein